MGHRLKLRILRTARVYEFLMIIGTNSNYFRQSLKRSDDSA
jgi:hypothetical protein